MMEREIRLERYRWSVRCFIGYTEADASFLCHCLTSIGCRGEAVSDAYRHFLHGGSDSGLTYTNVSKRVSLVAVGASDNPGSEVNTIGHELLHVVAHICEEDGIDPLSEEPCYIMGELCEKIFNQTIFKT